MANALFDTLANNKDFLESFVPSCNWGKIREEPENLIRVGSIHQKRESGRHDAILKTQRVGVIRVPVPLMARCGCKVAQRAHLQPRERAAESLLNGQRETSN